MAQITRPILVAFVFICVAFGHPALADGALPDKGPENGYEALGSLVYTAFGTDNDPVVKQVLLFHVRVNGQEWAIRTKQISLGHPGVAYWEGYHSANDDVLMVSSLAEPTNNNDPEMDHFRELIAKEYSNDVAFVSPLQRPSPRPKPSRITEMQVSKEAKPAKNVAVAETYRGFCPPADNSFISVLWFAYTPQFAPRENLQSTNALPQIWDDGHPVDRVLRHASWTSFDGPPYLVKAASFGWSKLNVAGNGNVITPDENIVPTNCAAVYDVKTTTNCGRFILPQDFELTRFVFPYTTAPAKVLITVSGHVIACNLLSSATQLKIRSPGKTLVSDYRLSQKSTDDQLHRYSAESNLIPTIAQIIKLPIVKSSSQSNKGGSERRRILIGRAILAFIALAPLLIFLLIRFTPQRS